MLEAARSPDPGTRVWRPGRCPWDEDPASVTAAGRRWSVNPDTAAGLSAAPGQRTVIWQAVVEDPAAQLLPRGNPASRVRQSPDSMAEVQFRPGAVVHLEGAWVADGPPRERGYFLPADPGRMGAGWRWHPAGRHVTVEHDPAPGWPGVPGLAFPVPPHLRTTAGPGPAEAQGAGQARRRPAGSDLSRKAPGKR
jgi:hypothetical protein